MTDKNRAAIIELAKQPGNNTCADCGAENPEWASASKGIFICIHCSGVHRNLGTQISVVKSLRLDTWHDDRLQFMTEHGNAKGNAIWAKNVPVWYRIPKCTDPYVLKEQWIRAKYERQEFVDGAPNPSYDLNGGLKKGKLKKKKKKEDSWNERLFILSEKEDSLAYFLKETDTVPKEDLRVSEINVVFADEKTHKPNSLQITWLKDGQTRNYFVASDSGEEIIDWYMAIRAAKFNILGLSRPGVKREEISDLLTRDFAQEGFLWKTGPRPNEGFQKRWFTLSGRRLLYFEKEMDAHPKGEIQIGSKDNGFDVTECENSSKRSHCFTLKTPQRIYNLSADVPNEKDMWMSALKAVIERPISEKEKREVEKAQEQHNQKKRSSLHRRKKSH
ncbi:arf-GAP with dual PH domain-containing protein 1-like [Actinia tenebrosa]|uniref:Arf-GAP with dual PH domain-containing protein 1-like n=1 Tax=Actinia tenebrosa TaxID=6105 RepID=A0A6P8ICD2_ACTTE|nr:arf-GAP with dual PH domain-containing protein 1-like [Actinia tenebrosa]